MVRQTHSRIWPNRLVGIDAFARIWLDLEVPFIATVFLFSQTVCELQLLFGCLAGNELRIVSLPKRVLQGILDKVNGYLAAQFSLQRGYGKTRALNEPRSLWRLFPPKYLPHGLKIRAYEN